MMNHPTLVPTTKVPHGLANNDAAYTEELDPSKHVTFAEGYN